QTVTIRRHGHHHGTPRTAPQYASDAPGIRHGQGCCRALLATLDRRQTDTMRNRAAPILAWFWRRGGRSGGRRSVRACGGDLPDTLWQKRDTLGPPRTAPRTHHRKTIVALTLWRHHALESKDFGHVAAN